MSTSSEFGYRVPPERVEERNRREQAAWTRELDSLAGSLARRRHAATLDVERLVARVGAFEVAVPSWGVGAGGTRFGRFSEPGEPRGIFEKLVDVATVHQLGRGSPRVSLHIPWDRPDDPRALVGAAAELGLGFDAMNSNTFQDQPGQELSYRYGSLSHTDARVREQAIAHNLEVVEFGAAIGSNALTVWIGDGGNYPGQIHFRRAYERVLASLGVIRARMPASWRLFVEYKPFEPAFYSTVINDWGTAYALCHALGEGASCLVDVGHHLPNTCIEQVVARLIQLEKLGGFHFNDQKFADDDLTAGSIRPYQLFLIFCELVDAEEDRAVDPARFRPSFMIDQSHNVKDPIEALLQTVDTVRGAYARALLVDREALADYQARNDVLMAESVLRDAYETDVRPLVAAARLRAGGALDPIAVYRESGYRAQKASERGRPKPGGGGIV